MVMILTQNAVHKLTVQWVLDTLDFTSVCAHVFCEPETARTCVTWSYPGDDDACGSPGISFSAWKCVTYGGKSHESVTTYAWLFMKCMC